MTIQYDFEGKSKLWISHQLDRLGRQNRRQYLILSYIIFLYILFYIISYVWSPTWQASPWKPVPVQSQRWPPNFLCMQPPVKHLAFPFAFSNNQMLFKYFLQVLTVVLAWRGSAGINCWFMFCASRKFNQKQDTWDTSFWQGKQDELLHKDTSLTNRWSLHTKICDIWVLTKLWFKLFGKINTCNVSLAKQIPVRQLFGKQFTCEVSLALLSWWEGKLSHWAQASTGTGALKSAFS